jgi:LmbE family N-acetylglucosaminyl deacetylase
MMSARQNKSTITNLSPAAGLGIVTEMNTTIPARLLILGAHPDDAEFHAGGLATLWAKHGGDVKIVSVTNGEAGHHLAQGPALVERRRREAAAAARVIGAASEVWDVPDGRLEANLELRWRIIREIRRFAPDLVLTHRTCDYHPDHRAVGQAVQDASYLVTVPSLVRDVPALSRDPVVGYMPDRFTKPAALQGDVVLDVGPQLESIVDMLACHESQVFEWLPFNQGLSADVPADAAGRRAWLRRWFQDRLRPQASRYRNELIATYGQERGSRIEWAEAYEISEYAAPLTPELRRKLFPFIF